MTFSGDNPQDPFATPAFPQAPAPAAPDASPISEIPPGDPFIYGAKHPQPYAFDPPSKSDLDVPWSCGHRLLFLLIGVLSFVMVQFTFMIYYILTKRLSTHPTQKEFQQFAYTTPFFSVGSMVIFFFQAEDGIRDYKVTGVQTCALPIWRMSQWEREDKNCEATLSFRGDSRSTFWAPSALVACQVITAAAAQFM